jgi:electron transport complex protein RnfD
MQKPERTLDIASSPHLNSGASVEAIMRQVIYALLPIVAFAVYSYGLAAVAILTASIASCLLTEYVLCRINDLPATLNDGSALITGIIYGLILPPALPLWMVIVGGIVCIALGKFLFGGLGANGFNPALVGRAFLQAAFPASMTTWWPAFSAERFSSMPASLLTTPFMSPHYVSDSISSATPLSAFKFGGVLTNNFNLFLGLTQGSLGETSSLIILLCGVYLIARRVMNWRIPAGIFIAAILLSGAFHWIDPTRYAGPFFMLFSGGLMLGAMFMATDPVASPITNSGCFIYGMLIGVLVVIIRYWGGLPEGVMYAILFCNALSPHIDRLLQPRVFGRRSGKPQHEAGHE